MENEKKKNGKPNLQPKTNSTRGEILTVSNNSTKISPQICDVSKGKLFKFVATNYLFVSARHKTKFAGEFR